MLLRLAFTQLVISTIMLKDHHLIYCECVIEILCQFICEITQKCLTLRATSRACLLINIKQFSQHLIKSMLKFIWKKKLHMVHQMWKKRDQQLWLQNQDIAIRKKREWVRERQKWFSVQLIGTHRVCGMICRINILAMDNLQFNLKKFFRLTSLMLLYMKAQYHDEKNSKLDQEKKKNNKKL